MSSNTIQVNRACYITVNDNIEYLMGQKNDTDHFYIRKTDYTISQSDPKIESNILGGCYAWIKPDIDKRLDNSHRLKRIVNKEKRQQITEYLTKKIYLNFLLKHYKTGLSSNIERYLVFKNFLDPLMKSLGIKNRNSNFNDTSSSEEESEDEMPLGFSVYDKASGIGYAKTNHGVKKVMWSCANNNVNDNACGLTPNLKKKVENIDLLLEHCHKERFIFEMNNLQQSNTSEIYLSILMPHFDKNAQDMLKDNIGEFVNFSCGYTIQQVLPKLEYILREKKELSTSKKIKDKIDDLNKICNYIKDL